MAEKNEGESYRSNSSENNEGICNKNGVIGLDGIQSFDVRLNRKDKGMSKVGRNELIKEIIEIEKKKRHCSNYFESDLELEVKRIEVYKPVLITKNRLMVINTQTLTEALRPKVLTENVKQRYIQFINKLMMIIQRKRLNRYFNVLKLSSLKRECKVMIRKINRIQSAKSITTNKITESCLIYNSRKRYLKHHYFSKCFKTNDILQCIMLIQNKWRKKLSAIRSKMILDQMRSKYPLKLKGNKKKTVLNQSLKNTDNIMIKRMKPYTITKVLYCHKSILDNSIEKTIQFKSQLNRASSQGQCQKLTLKAIQISKSYITKTRITKYKSIINFINVNQQLKEDYNHKLNSLSRLLLKSYWNIIINRLKSHLPLSNVFRHKHSKEESNQFTYSIHKILSKNIQEKVFNYLNTGYMYSQSFYYTTLVKHLQLINDYTITSLRDNAFEVRIALSHYFTQVNTLNVYSLYFNDKAKEKLIEDNLIKDIYSVNDIKKLIAYMSLYISKYYSNLFPIKAILITKIKEYLNQYKTINTSIFGISRLIHNFIKSSHIEGNLKHQIQLNKGNITIMLNQVKANRGNREVLLYNNKSICNYYTINAYERSIDLDTTQKQFLQLHIEGNDNERTLYINDNNKYHYYSNIKINDLNKWKDNKAIP